MMAEIILKNKSPNLILCSTAIRAKETLGHLIRLNIESPTLYDESLYLAEPKKITDCIIKNASDIKLQNMFAVSAETKKINNKDHFHYTDALVFTGYKGFEHF